MWTYADEARSVLADIVASWDTPGTDARVYGPAVERVLAGSPSEPYVSEPTLIVHLGLGEPGALWAYCKHEATARGDDDGTEGTVLVLTESPTRVTCPECVAFTNAERA